VPQANLETLARYYLAYRTYVVTIDCQHQLLATRESLAIHAARATSLETPLALFGSCLSWAKAKVVLHLDVQIDNAFLVGWPEQPFLFTGLASKLDSYHCS
jgi:hypothetical protein